MRFNLQIVKKGGSVGYTAMELPDGSTIRDVLKEAKRLGYISVKIITLDKIKKGGDNCVTHH